MRNGVFNHYLLKGLRGAADGAYGMLRDGFLTFRELSYYVVREVKVWSFQNKKLQRPFPIWPEGTEHDVLLRDFGLRDETGPTLTVTTPSSTSMSGADRLALLTADSEVRDALAESNAVRKSELLEAALRRTDPLRSKHEDDIPLWPLRAVAAMGLDDAERGSEARIALKRLAAMDQDSD